MQQDRSINLRLWQLCSSSLPVGAYSFSQGLEYAIDANWLVSAEDVSSWIRVCLNENQAKTDIPILIRQYQATQSDDLKTLTYWNDYLLASRESLELYDADISMGKALLKLLPVFGIPSPYQPADEVSFVTAFALAAGFWQTGCEQSCHGFLWSWLENQILAASKLLPLGQTAAQKMLLDLSQHIVPTVDNALLVVDEAIGNSLPALAIASACHETQYSRLFRS